MRTVIQPARAKSSPRNWVVVVLPVPPLLLATATMVADMVVPFYRNR